MNKKFIENDYKNIVDGDILDILRKEREFHYVD